MRLWALCYNSRSTGKTARAQEIRCRQARQGAWDDRCLSAFRFILLWHLWLDPYRFMQELRPYRCLEHHAQVVLETFEPWRDIFVQVVRFDDEQRASRGR